MKKNDNHKRLKQLSDQHEVPFNPASWDRMEALLDNTPPPEEPRLGASFFNYKNILAMLILLMILMYFVVPTGEVSPDDAATNTIATTSSTDSYISAKNDTLKQETKEITNTDLQKSLGAGRTTDGKIIDPNDPNPQLISEPQPIDPLAKFGLWDASKFPNPIQSVPTNIFQKTIPTDNVFIEKIKEQLTLYTKFRSEEKVYLHFDRTMLKPGESIWFSAYVRNADNLKPSEKSDIVYVDFIAPNGGVLKQLKLVTENGVAKGDILTTPEMVGGIYKVKAYTNWQKNFATTFERKITLQKTVLPHLRMEMDFAKEAYGAGDEVVVKLDLNTLENAPLANYNFTYQVSLAGANISSNNATTDEKGHAEVKFNLPKELNSNDGLVNVMLQYNGQGESISRSIPIVLNKMDLQFFPEGGDLVAGFENKIAFKALNEFGKPADVEGIVTNSQGAIVGSFQSYHQGMGAFDFKPLPNEKYIAKITKPSSIIGEFPLPVILEKGNLMQVVKVEEDKMQVRVQSVESQSLTLVLQSQGNVVYSTATEAKAGTHLIEIPTQKFPIGIAQLTMFDEMERPHSERLVFLNKNKTLDVSITTDKDQYLPREKVKMQIQVKDENGNPVQGQFSVGVSDDKLLTFADDKQGKMLAYLLLESDLKGEINEPNFYFEPKEKHLDKDQNLALDYLMMTNGWRRYTWKYERKEIAGMVYPNEKATISGSVINNLGQAIKDVVVRIEGTDKTAISDKNGKFTFENISLFNSKSNRNGLVLFASQNNQQKIYVNNYGNNFIVRVPNAKIQNFDLQTFPSRGKSQIKGKILDANGEALIGANVFLEGTKIGAITDLDGNYVIKNVPEGTYALRSDYIGHTPITQAVSVKRNQSLWANGTLSEGNNLMNEVVVTQYKVPLIKQDETQSGGTITTAEVMDFRQPIIEEIADDMVAEEVPTKSGGVITNDQISKLPTRNIDAIAAVTAGTSSADEGAGVTIRGSRSDATDLFIDGIRVDGNQADFDFAMNSQLNVMGSIGEKLKLNKSNKNTNEERKIVQGGSVKESKSKKRKSTMMNRNGNTTIIMTDEPVVIIDGNALDKISLANVKPKDIKSVEVIEGDDALATYGVRAKNGVILIDTKKRKSGATNQALIDYQNGIVSKINDKVETHQTRYEWAKKMITTQALNRNQTRDLKIFLNSSLSEIKSMQSVAAELGRLTGSYPQTNYADRDFDFIGDYEYAHNFRNGFYQAREFYAPKYVAKSKKEIRDDFRPTIFWNPLVETDMTGKAFLEFYNSDDLTTFKATVEGLTTQGKIGTATHTYFTQMPFGMRTKFPTQVLVGDVLNIPVTISNNTKANMDVKLDAIVPQGFEYVGKEMSLYSVGSEQVMTVYLPFKVKSAAGEHDLEVKVTANGEEDSFTKTVQVISTGFPVNLMYSGTEVEDNFQVNISHLVEGSVQAKFSVYPSTLSNITSGMDRMIRQPTGCFEQTSSKNYPNLLVLDLLKNTNTLEQSLAKRLDDVLEKGYQRLLTFEIQGGGFDWFGRPPGHEGLSAYGLMQFKDMQRVHRVDQAVIDRTAKWLLTRKNGTGGWKNSKRGAHSWDAHSPAADAYITWAMTEADYGGQVRAEIEKTYSDAKESKDAYVMALAVNALHNIKDGRANKLLQDLLKLQNEDGSWAGKATMTKSGGQSLKIETTALVALAIMKVGKGRTHLEKAMNFIGKSKTDYGFGSTQSTVLAMKALIEHVQFSTKSKATDGIVTLMVDGKKVASQAFSADQKSAIVFDEINEFFTEGKHDIKVLFDGTEVALPYDLAVNYNTTLPVSDSSCKLKLKTDLQKASGKIGDNIRLTIQLQNLSKEGLSNPIAKIGIPAGLNLQPWQLKELQEKGAFDYYEIKNGSLIIYHRGIESSETKTVHLDLKADLAGTYEAPASSAYLYYTNEFRSWSKPELVRIDSK